MRTTTLLVSTLAILTAGCGFIGNPDSRADALSPHDDVYPGGGGDGSMTCEYPSVLSDAHFAVDLRDCEKLEGGQLGEDLTFEVNGETVTISDWQNKEGEGEYVGFHVDGDVVIVVKAGTDLHETGEGTWVHPNGTEGPTVKGISFVAFCEPPTDDPVCTPSDGGDPSGGDGGDPSGGDGGDPSGGDDPDGYCEPYTCEPGGGIGGGDDDTSGGDSGGDTSGGDGGATCAVTACGADNLCPDNHACYDGCCIEVIL